MLVIAIVSGLALAGIRRVLLRQGDDHSQAAEVVAVFGAIGLAYFLLLALMLGVGPWILVPGTPPLYGGALFGVAVASIRFAAAASAYFLEWSLGRSPNLELSRPRVVSALAMLVGLAVVGGLFLTALVAVDTLLGPLALLALPLLLAGYPLFDLVIMPRVTRLTRFTRPFGPGDQYGESLAAWVSETPTTAGLRRHRLEVVETGAENAWAIHLPPFAPLILLSRALLEENSEESMRAIVAHEIAHIICRHVPRLELAPDGGQLFSLGKGVHRQGLTP